MLPFGVIGIKDGFNPCLISLALLYAVLLVFWGRRSLKYKIYGVISFIVLIIVRLGVLFVSALYDSSSIDVVNMYLYYVYWIVAILLVWIGCVNVKDWAGFLKNNQKEIEGVDFLEKKETRLYLKKIVIAVIVGALIPVVASVWSESTDLYFRYFFLTNEGKYIEGFLGFFGYSVGYAWPIGLFLLSCFVVDSNKFVKRWLSNHFSLIKILIAAIYVSAGIGLGIILLK